MLTILLSMIRAGWRNLSRQPGFTTMVVTVLALGLTIAISMFSVLRAVVLASLPFADAERVVMLSSTNVRQSATALLTPAESQALGGDSSPFAASSHYNWGGETVLRSGEAPREFTVAVVGPDFFSVLQPKLLLGRGVSPEDVAKEAKVIVLSHGQWQRTFGSDPDVVGKKISLVSGQAEVIGVLPPEFQFPGPSVGGWIPMFARAMPGPETPAFAHARYVPVVARLRPGVSTDAARAFTETKFAEVAAGLGIADQGWRPVVDEALDDLLGETRRVLWACFGVALLVLVIACTNAGLALQARLLARSREHAVALALGAGRRHLLGVTLMELLLLSATAVALALLASQATIGVLSTALADTLPRGEGISLDGHVVLASVALALASVLLASLLGIRFRAEPADALRSGRSRLGPRQRWLRFGPAVGMALSTIALIAATALALSMYSLNRVAPGFRTEGVHVLQMFRGGGPAEWRRFAPATLTELQSEPGLTELAYTTAAPLSTIGRFELDAQLPGKPGVEPYQAVMRAVSPGYRALLGVPLQLGRDFESTDRDGTLPVAIINQTLARQSFGTQSPIGKTLLLPLGDGPRVAYTVVGVMDDHRNRGPRQPVQAEIWLPFDQVPWVGVSFVARSGLPSREVHAALQRALGRAAADEAPTRIFALADDFAETTRLTSVLTRLLIGFGLCALALAGFGLYALTSLIERSRVPEFGLRLAVGALPSRLAQRVVRDALVLSGIGFVVGAGIAWAALLLLRSQLFGLGASPWSSYVLTGVVLMIAAVLATLIPARRVARLDPMRALQSE